MYCKKCGAEIADDSIYCSQCGIRVTDEIPSETNNEPKEKKPAVTTTEKGGCSDGCLITSLVFFLTLIALVVAFGIGIFHYTSDGNDGSNSSGGIAQIIKRDARNSDIEISNSLDIPSLSISLTIHPNCDIDNLEITLNYYDKNGTFLKTQVEKIGNVKEGKEETINISITDFSFTEIFKIYETEVGVTGGSVSIFQ